jgi:hypothetical protein
LYRGTKRLIAGLAVLISAGLLWFWISTDGERPPSGPERNLEAPTPWRDQTTDASRRIRWKVSGEGPPSWSSQAEASEQQRRPLDMRVPRADDPIAWRGVRRGASLWLVGSTSIDGRDLEISIAMSDGNPQARLSVRWDAPALSERTDPVTVRWHLPDGDTRFMGNRLDIETIDEGTSATVSPWRPTWIRWTGKGSALTLRGWNGDGFGVETSGAGPSIDLKVWDPTQHVGAEDCESTTDGNEQPAIVASALLVFGDESAVAASPLPGGHRAALSPMFDVPAALPDATLRQGDARTAEDWVKRVRTLLYGHSSSDDPRYGNGGLLGHNLGGSIVVPARFADADAVADLNHSVANKAIGFAVRRDAETPDGFVTHFSTKTGCAPPNENAPTLRVPDLVSGSHGTANLVTTEGRLGSPAHLNPADLVPTRLDGRRTSFVDQTVLRGRIDKLVDDHAKAAFTTPLLGSRNPLTPPAKEALLQPERWGEWTLHPDVSSALADLDHWTDAHPLMVAAPSSWVHYWRRARDVRLRWAPDGTLEAASSVGEEIDGFTLLFPTATDLSVSVDGNPADGSRSARGATRVWWDLDEHRTHRISAREGRRLSPPAPVRWTLEQ